MNTIVLSGPANPKVYAAWNSRLTLEGEGNVVLLVTLPTLEGNVCAEQQELLDAMRIQKVAHGTVLFVLDVGGHIDPKTEQDIQLAKMLSIPIRYLSEEYPDWKED